MTNSIQKLCLFALAASIGVPCFGQSCPDQESAAVVRFVNNELKTGSPLYAERMPHLREALVSLKTKRLTSAIGAEVPPVEFYRVSPANYELRAGRVVGESVQLDNDSEWIVAVNCKWDRSLLLEGSPEPLSRFNEIIRDLHLNVDDAATALSIFDVFVQTVRGSKFRSEIVSDEMKLESLALEDFRLRFSATQRREAFNVWWARLPKAVLKSLGPPKAEPSKDRFDIKYFSYSEGAVLAGRLVISSDGAVSEAKETYLINSR